MSNLLNQNPIILTATLASYKAAVATSQGSTIGPLRVTKVYWLDPATIGDQAILVDPRTGNVLEQFRCEVAGQSQIIHPKVPLWKDFELLQIDSGTIEISLA